MTKYIKYSVIVLLIILPITDLIFKTSEAIGEEPNRYSFYIRIAALLLIVFFLLWNINHFINIFRNPVVGAMGVLLAYILGHFLFTYEEGESIVSIVKISYVFIVFFFFYLLALSDTIRETDIRWLYALMIVIVFLTILQFIPLRATLRSTGLAGMADNKGYTLVSAFPTLLLFYKKKTFPFLIGLVSIGVLIAGKRGAILCLLASALTMCVFMRKENRRLTFTTFLYGLLALIGLVFLLSYFNEYISVAFERIFAITIDHGSGRDYLYQKYWSGFWNSDNFHFIFGHGLFGGIKYLNISIVAHSDWLEILYDYGIVGAFLYLNVFIQLFRYLISGLPRQNKVYYYVLLGFILMLFIRSFISGTFLMTVETIWIYISVAFVLGKVDNMMYKELNFAI
ncbi:O-antigen ligase family protein [Limibacterium fermenti]|uniref:O-antigen ligase family protein n=1 Tax=Limibacterium fermenti TaxID=3229863 RepID=UPI003A6E0382